MVRRFADVVRPVRQAAALITGSVLVRVVARVTVVSDVDVREAAREMDFLRKVPREPRRPCSESHQAKEEEPPLRATREPGSRLARRHVSDSSREDGFPQLWIPRGLVRRSGES